MGISRTFLFALVASMTKCHPTVETSQKVTPESSSEFEILILHNNDMHARFEQTSQLSGVCSPDEQKSGKCYGGFARIAHIVKKARAAAANGSGPAVLFLNAGDTYTGSFWFTYFKWEVAAEYLNALEPDVVTLGNHEFDLNLKGLAPFIQNLKAPTLAANLLYSKIPDLKNQPNLKNSTILTVKNTDIGIIGYLTPETQVLSFGKNLHFIDEVDALVLETKKLQNKGVKIIIAIGHSGYAKDLEIAREVEGIDLVIGAHTHSFLWNGTTKETETVVGPYPTIVRQKSGRLVPVVQAYAYTKYLGELLLKFDAEGEIINYKGKPIVLDKNIPEDTEILQISKRYKDKLDAISYVIVGSTNILLDGVCRLRECNLGNLIADAMVSQYPIDLIRTENTLDEIPLAIVLSGSIRSSLNVENDIKNLTRGDILTVQPFGNLLTALKINGSVLNQVLEHSVADYNPVKKLGRFLQYSGVKVVYDLSKKPGSRVVSAIVRCSTCLNEEYQDIEINKEYTVLMSSFLAEGLEGFDFLKDLPTKKYAITDYSILENHLKIFSPVSPTTEGRITLLNEPQNKLL